jgi:hypothetical protein
MTNLFLKFTAFVSSFLVVAAFAQSADVKINDIPATEDTTITIKKGSAAEDKKNSYEIISGSDEISSDEEYDDKKALAGWKQACSDFKKEIKELNRENSILIVSCGSKVKNLEKNKTVYKSLATYRIKVKIKD